MIKDFRIKRELEDENATITLVEKGIEENWLTNNFAVWDWRNNRHNYLAIVTRNEKGENLYKWLKQSKNSDEFFNVADVQKGDILLAGCKKAGKSYSTKLFYGVVERTTDCMKVVSDTTYLKVKKLLSAIKKGDVTASVLKNHYTIHNPQIYTGVGGCLKIVLGNSCSDIVDVEYKTDENAWFCMELDENPETGCREGNIDFNEEQDGVHSDLHIRFFNKDDYYEFPEVVFCVNETESYILISE